MDMFSDELAPDRRSSQRHSVRTALRVRVWNSAQPEHRAESVNVSLRGIYFNTKTSLCEGEIVEVLLKMPEEVSGEETTEWRCTGHVVRVEPFDATKGQLGVGVQFYCYEAARPEQASMPLAAGPKWRVIPYGEPRRAAGSAGANGLEVIFKDMERSGEKGPRTN
jgi:PilZ domain